MANEEKEDTDHHVIEAETVSPVVAKTRKKHLKILLSKDKTYPLLLAKGYGEKDKNDERHIIIKDKFKEEVGVLGSSTAEAWFEKTEPRLGYLLKVCLLLERNPWQLAGLVDDDEIEHGSAREQLSELARTSLGDAEADIILALGNADPEERRQLVAPTVQLLNTLKRPTAR